MVDVVEPAPAPPRRPVVAYITLAVAALVVALFIVLAVSKGTTDTAKTELLGQAAPPIKSTTINGQSFDLSTRRGSWVVLNFFATWCAPCRTEHPELLRFAQEHAGSGVELVSLADATDTASGIQTFLNDNGGAGDWPIVTDPSSSIRIDYGVAKTPETWIIDPNGIVRARIITTVTASKLDAVLARVSS